MTNKHVCFDLEDTLIAPVLQGWSNWEPILNNIAVFKQWLIENEPATVNIFSFAIHDNSDLQQFNTFVRPRLEKMLKRTFLFVPMVLEGSGSIRTACATKFRCDPLSVTFNDMLDFWGKAGAFRLWATKFGTAEGGDNEVHLFDDDVEDQSIILPPSWFDYPYASSTMTKIKYYAAALIIIPLLFLGDWWSVDLKYAIRMFKKELKNL